MQKPLAAFTPSASSRNAFSLLPTSFHLTLYSATLAPLSSISPLYLCLSLFLYFSPLPRSPFPRSSLFFSLPFLLFPARCVTRVCRCAKLSIFALACTHARTDVPPSTVADSYTVYATESHAIPNAAGCRHRCRCPIDPSITPRASLAKQGINPPRVLPLITSPSLVFAFSRLRLRGRGLMFQDPVTSNAEIICLHCNQLLLPFKGAAPEAFTVSFPFFERLVLFTLALVGARNNHRRMS